MDAMLPLATTLDCGLRLGHRQRRSNRRRLRDSGRCAVQVQPRVRRHAPVPHEVDVVRADAQPRRLDDRRHSADQQQAELRFGPRIAGAYRRRRRAVRRSRRVAAAGARLASRRWPWKTRGSSRRSKISSKSSFTPRSKRSKCATSRRRGIRSASPRSRSRRRAPSTRSKAAPSRTCTSRRISCARFATRRCLHDFGKVAVPEYIFGKAKKLPDGRLDTIRLRFLLAIEQTVGEENREALRALLAKLEAANEPNVVGSKGDEMLLDALGAPLPRPRKPAAAARAARIRVFDDSARLALGRRARPHAGARHPIVPLLARDSVGRNAVARRSGTRLRPSRTSRRNRLSAQTRRRRDRAASSHDDDQRRLRRAHRSRIVHTRKGCPPNARSTSYKKSSSTAEKSTQCSSTSSSKKTSTS